MLKTKEAELTSAVLLYAIRCIAEGDFKALRKLNVGEREVNEMKRIGIRELYHAGSMRSHCVSVKLNRDMFWSMIRHMREQSHTDDVLQLLIDKDAPFELVRDFYGLSAREYTKRRSSAKVKNKIGRGRPVEPTIEESDRLWKAWRSHPGKDDSGRLISAEDYMVLADKLDMSIRSVWLLTERWNETHKHLEQQRSNRLKKHMA